MKILLAIILLLQIFKSFSWYCSKKELFYIGVKTFCESDDENSISCLSNPVKKAYIRCDGKYRNDRNISEQIIDCMDNNQWSEPPMRCLPVCSKISELFENKRIQRVNGTGFSKSYAELVRKDSNDSKPIIFPAFIISERTVLVGSNNLSSKINNDDFLIKIYKPNGVHKMYKIFSKLSYGDKFYGILIPQNEYIKFDEWTQPACIDSDLLNLINRDSDKNFEIPDAPELLPTYEEKCVLPEVDSTKIDIQCLKKESNFFFDEYELLNCSKSVEGFISRCEIGYENMKLEQNDAILTKCNKNNWEFFGHNDDCELVCGTTDNNSEFVSTPLLYKGEKTDITSVPWHVGIYINDTKTKNFEHICGGTIIHSNIVISAAHCFHDKAKNKKQDAARYLIGAGKTYRSYETIEKYNQYIEIKAIGLPPNYNPVEYGNDIAIIILEEHLKFSSHVRSVCIDWKTHEYYYIQNGLTGYVSGWGTTSMDDIPSEELLKINLTTITNDECKKLVKPNARSEITGEKFCATNENQSAACGGDSGGGFVIKKNTKYGERYYLLGIVNIGLGVKNYCSDQFITLFTNIQFYQGMIKDIISKNRIEDISNRPILLYPFQG